VDNGSYAYSLVDLAISLGSLNVGILKPQVFKLYKYDRSLKSVDFVKRYRTLTRRGLMIESGATLSGIDNLMGNEQ